MLSDFFLKKSAWRKKGKQSALISLGFYSSKTNTGSQKENGWKNLHLEMHDDIHVMIYNAFESLTELKQVVLNSLYYLE